MQNDYKITYLSSNKLATFITQGWYASDLVPSKLGCGKKWHDQPPSVTSAWHLLIRYSKIVDNRNFFTKKIYFHSKFLNQKSWVQRIWTTLQYSCNTFSCGARSNAFSPTVKIDLALSTASLTWHLRFLMIQHATTIADAASAFGQWTTTASPFRIVWSMARILSFQDFEMFTSLQYIQ